MSILSKETEKKFEDVIVSTGVLTEEKLNDAIAKSGAMHKPLVSYLLDNKLVSDEQVTKVNAKITNLPYVNLTAAQIDSKVLELLPKEIAQRYMAVPLGEIQHRLVVAMLDANNVQAVDFLANRIARPLKVYVASEAGIKNIIAQYDRRLDTQMKDAFKTDPSNSKESKESVEENKNAKSINIVEDSPISKALSAILEFASNNRASDIHIEPFKDELIIRCRIDGVLREVMHLPKSTEPAFISRIKILSNLKIDEHRIPQDGQFSVNVSKKEIDLRISISPVVWGEQVVIRLLDKTGTSLKLEDMGYAGRPLRTIRKTMKEPNGMILTSGPTGSGKSTSMYAIIQEIKNESINIVTLEDPVEYKVDGVNQIQVNADIGLTFASGLRSILRQDPDVIMIGEIRDKETAQLAVQASLTGHLVLSTLHTNSAAGILPRLLDMGVEPFLIASTVRTVIGQRLVRRISDKDKEQIQSTQPETLAIQQTIGNLLPKTNEDIAKVSEDLGYKSLPLANQTAYTLSRGKDSAEAPGGYRGRMGLYEVFSISNKIQELIMNRSTSTQIQAQAQAEGMITMRQDGYLKVLDGKTTLNEVNRVASDDKA